MVFKIGILEKQITLGGLHSGIGQFVQSASLGVDPGLGRFKARLCQLIFELCHIAGCLELLGGAL